MESEIEGYGGKVQELMSESQALLSREHFDREMIQKKQVCTLTTVYLNALSIEIIFIMFCVF